MNDAINVLKNIISAKKEAKRFPYYATSNELLNAGVSRDGVRELFRNPEIHKGKTINHVYYEFQSDFQERQNAVVKWQIRKSKPKRI